MYTTSVITDEISQDLKVAAQMAREYGLQGLEIRSVNEKNPFQMEKADVKFVKSVAEDFGLRICAVSSPMYKCDFGDLAVRRQHEEAFRRFMETMHEWNVSLIRTFNFFNLHDGGAKLPEIAEMYQKLADVAEDAGVTMVLESEPSVNAVNIAELVKFLKMVDRASVQAVYDPGNELADVTAPPPYPDGYRILRPWIRHVHVKDIKRGSEMTPAPLGEGDVDFHGIFDALRRDEYNGWVSLETHYRVIRMSDEDLVRPQGSSFSKGGYEASRLYLDRLRDVYRWMEA
ncbi:MAG: sugar phosphate isomerase/epimerase [Clostridiales bacterium]|nr:sugar phosphate isomerase/epimerase [Clostridiales bacterium]MDY4007919.1 sugar phosphate isomerase/epimerase family protein [Candidatus Limiplasma sp.]